MNWTSQHDHSCWLRHKATNQTKTVLFYNWKRLHYRDQSGFFIPFVCARSLRSYWKMRANNLFERLWKPWTNRSLDRYWKLHANRSLMKCWNLRFSISPMGAGRCWYVNNFVLCYMPLSYEQCLHESGLVWFHRKCKCCALEIKIQVYFIWTSASALWGSHLSISNRKRISK